MATSEWLAAPTSWTSLTTNLLGGNDTASQVAAAAREVPPFDEETLRAAASFFEPFAAHPRQLDWWRKLIPANVYGSINTAFFAFASESHPALRPRRGDATTRLVAAGEGAQEEASWADVRSHGSPAGWEAGQEPHCRWFVSAKEEGIGMHEDDIKAQGFLYWTCATCSCFYTYWAQSAGTLMPIPIWDYMGWQEAFWTMHRFPIKIVCGLLYFVLKNIGLIIMLALVVLWVVLYGWLLNRLTKLSWEWGITQSWNQIAAVMEEELDNGILEEHLLDAEPEHEVGGRPKAGGAAAGATSPGASGAAAAAGAKPSG